MNRELRVQLMFSALMLILAAVTFSFEPLYEFLSGHSLWNCLFRYSAAVFVLGGVTVFAEILIGGRQ